MLLHLPIVWHRLGICLEEQICSLDVFRPHGNHSHFTVNGALHSALWGRDPLLHRQKRGGGCC